MRPCTLRAIVAGGSLLLLAATAHGAARALVMDPPVLILDDCLSSVDAQTEAEILHGLKAIIKEKTCLIISHRISAVKEADEILVLDEGKIVERGSHDELVRRGGIYADLYQQQQLTEELEQI